MKYRSLIGKEEQSDVLKSDYEAGTKVGIISLGNGHLFFRKLFRTYYIAYADLNAAFRRVYMMNGRKNSLAAEYIVLVSGDREIANIGVPGTKNAKGIIEIIKEKAPHIETNFKGDAV